MSESAERPAAASPRSDDSKPVRPAVLEWSSEELLGEANEARIIHGDEVYRLLRTRNHKLILVK